MFTSFLYCLCIITTLPFCNAQKTQRLIYKPANDPTGEKQYYLGVMFEFDDRRKEAIQWYLTSAKLGFVHAQTHLGNIYRDGRIVKKSNKKALKWFTAAALQKDNDALFSLGRMHELGTSATPKSFKQALKLYKKAAKQGHAASQYNLAAMYSRGDGVIANNKIAEKYQLQAAAQGDTDAMFKLGLFEEFGVNRKPAKKKALYWYTRALSFVKYNKLHGRDLGYISTQKIKDKIKSLQPDYDPQSCGLPLGFLLNVSNSSSQQDREKANHIAKNIAKTLKRALKGSAVDQFKMGTIVYEGLQFLGKGEKKYIKSIQWFQKSAAQGHAAAMVNLGIMTLHGEGVAKSYSKAHSWFQKCLQSAEVTTAPIIARCEHSLGDMHYLYDSSDPILTRREIADAADWDERNRPIPSKKDLSIAFDYYKRAAHKESTEAMYSIALMWSRGHAGDPSPHKLIDKASHWYLKAAQQGHTFAQTNLANVYYWGQSESHPFTQSNEKAAFWFKKAASSGDNFAQQTLGYMHMYGEIEPSDTSLKQAKKWLTKSSKQGNVVAQYNLGVLYEHGLNRPELAKQWYRKAAVQTNVLSVAADTALDVVLSAQYRYGLLCVASSDPKEVRQGMRWLKKAAKKGNQDAQQALDDLKGK